MGRKNKKFIDKKTDVVYSFRVGARSQRDPLAADETAPQGVLIEDNPQDLNKTEEKNYGIYFDDDYDYLKHLRNTSEGINWNDDNLEVYEIRKEDPQANKKELRNKRLKLPSSVFESYVEEPIGLLNRAAPISGPCPELDPDVVAHLDGAFPHKEDVSGVDNILDMLGQDDGEWEDVEDEEIWGEGRRYKEDEDHNYHLGEYVDEEMPPLEELDEIDYPMPETIIKESRDSSSGESDAEEEDCWSTTGADRDYGSEYNVSEDEERDQLGVLRGQTNYGYPDDDDTKSHFTEYSMSSSVVKRNKQLTDLDDQFQAMFIREYNEEQIGALDGKDIEGYISENSPLYQQAYAQTKKQLATESSLEDEKDWIVKWIEDQEEKIETGQISNYENEEITIEDKVPDHKWDCQSILSSYSNLYNHPKILDKPNKKIAIHPLTGLPLEPTKKGLTRKALELHNGDDDMEETAMDTRTILSTISAISVRPPGETPEQRNERKNALKELRRERRIEKKINKLAFKDEKKRQEKVNMNKSNSNVVKVV